MHVTPIARDEYPAVVGIACVMVLVPLALVPT